MQCGQRSIAMISVDCCVAPLRTLMLPVWKSTAAPPVEAGPPPLRNNAKEKASIQMLVWGIS